MGQSLPILEIESNYFFNLLQCKPLLADSTILYPLKNGKIGKE